MDEQTNEGIYIMELLLFSKWIENENYFALCYGQTRLTIGILIIGSTFLIALLSRDPGGYGNRQ